MSKPYPIDDRPLTIKAIDHLLRSDRSIELAAGSQQRITQCRAYLEQRLAQSGELLYGINTGFGSLCNVQISENEVQQLQHNLVKSHACGCGPVVPDDVVRLMLLLKIKSLSQGYSGVRLSLVERLITFYNAGVLPVVYEQGSLGASGDLAPLAHLSLPLIGLGEVRYQGQVQKAGPLLEKLGLAPLQLEAKEGLALLNGTQFSTAYGGWILQEANRLINIAHLCAALSVDAFHCRMEPFDDRLHQIRPHPGQIATAETIRSWLSDSPIAQRPKRNVQDPYAFRCVPQVHGASMDAIAHTRDIWQREANAVTDNPNIFPDTDAVLSGGNFHAQPIALALDYLAIALAELGSISERRVFQLISGVRGLPPFLIKNAGLCSGLMIPQYTAASIVSQNKQLCTPASVDSIVSSNGQEDHVSMAANAATKAYRVAENLERLLAIEWMTAAQAIYCRRPEATSPRLEYILKYYRKWVSPLEQDRPLYHDIRATVVFLRGGFVNQYFN